MFSHPLARDAKVWRTAGFEGEVRPLLVVITTLELDPNHKKFRAEKVDHLRGAAKQWLGAHPDVANDVLLMNRPKTWAGDKS